MKPNQVVELISKELKIPVTLLVSNRRLQAVSEARWLVAYHLRRLFLLTYRELGCLFNKTPAALLLGIRRLEELRKMDKHFAGKFNRVEEKLKAKGLK